MVTFGEVMGRLVPEGFHRLRQAVPGVMRVTFAGSEANVAAGVCQLGGAAAFVTALPKHAIADACVSVFEGLGVDTRYVVRTEAGRLGLYFLETGANQRPSKVVYDRTGSAVSVTGPENYPWAQIFEGADWFHISGITPAVSRVAADATMVAVREAKHAGLTVSCDLNFRGQLWRWDASRGPRELARATMERVLQYVDVVMANESDAFDVLRIETADGDVEAGKLVADRYPAVARAIRAKVPNVSTVAITLRESLSASCNNWGALLYDGPTDRAYLAPWRGGRYQPYVITDIVDRVGAGDAFAAALIVALGSSELGDPPTTIAFATAASCLAHSITGDINYVSRAEVEALMRGSASGRIVR